MAKEKAKPIYGTELGEKVCAVCGKVFCVRNSETWAYKRPGPKGMRYCCSWGCLRSLPENGKPGNKIPESTKRAIYQLIAEGYTDREIAAKLRITAVTARYWRKMTGGKSE